MKQTWVFVALILGVGLLTLVLLFAFQEGGGPVVDDSDFQTTSSGLKYKDVKVGSGQEAKAGDHVVVHYTGSLRDGTIFDSSRNRNEPFDFKLGIGSVIRGWDEGVAGMKVGGKRSLIIPPDLGYAGRRQGKIPPNSVLYFDVDLIAIK